jgi:hypothetical protein
VEPQWAGARVIIVIEVLLGDTTIRAAVNSDGVEDITGGTHCPTGTHVPASKLQHLLTDPVFLRVAWWAYLDERNTEREAA